MKKNILTILMFTMVGTVFSTVRPKITQTFGSDSYRATDVSLLIGKSFYVQPGYHTYSSDLAAGTYQSYSAKMGFNANRWGLALDGGVAPEHNDYSNSYVGSDIYVLIPLTGGIGGSEKDLINLELGAGVRGTQHKDNLQVDPTALVGLTNHSVRTLDQGRGRGGSGGGGRGADDLPTLPRGSAIEILQTEVTVSAGLDLFSLVAVDLDYSKSDYNKDLVAILARDPQNEHSVDVAAFVKGYRDTNISSKFSVLCLPIFTPYISYSKTTFNLGEADATVLGLGTSISLAPVTLSVGYESYDPGAGASKRSYTSIGAGVRF